MATRLRQARSQLTRARFLAAAAELLNADPSAELSMPAVARRAGRSVGALYEHFGSKDALLDAVGEDYAARRDAFIDEHFDGPRWAGSTGTERAAGFIRAFVGWYRGNRGVLRMLVLRAWSSKQPTTPASVGSFRANIRAVAEFVCGEHWTALSTDQRRAAEHAVHYAIVLARDALVIDDATAAILEPDDGADLEADLLRIVQTFLEGIPA
ncbi:MAG: TetR/AcrR family transcriptional regulator [Planctomycetota bacterium]|jgi:AcrR family transcriptional regulator